MHRTYYLVVGITVWFAPWALTFFQNPSPTEPEIEPKDRSHWAFQPPTNPQPPLIQGKQEIINPIDLFLLEKLQEKKLTFSNQAKKGTLIRRLALDLTGLPPTPAEIENFESDTSPTAYEKLVDKLLASPHFGERWGQYWLDVVRYAETNGYELDAERQQAWRYRDYVIRAFNQDRPYTQFVMEQIAGDLTAKKLLLPKEETSFALQRNPKIEENLTAAGFLRCGPTHVVSGNLDQDVLRQETLTEMATSIGTVFLGLTMGCARCHDHKFDPISQVDYYRLQAFVGRTFFTEVELSPMAKKKAAEEELTRWKKQLAPFQKGVEALDGPVRAKLMKAKVEKLDAESKAAWFTDPKQRTPQQHKLASAAEQIVKSSWDEVLNALSPKVKAERDGLKNKIHELERIKPEGPAKTLTVRDLGSSGTPFLKRGNPKNKGALIPPGYPRVLISNGIKQNFTSDLNREDLAKWIIRPDNPLTARVYVNRIWLQLFGTGLVDSPTDFGIRTPRPLHLPLLDWLVHEFIQSDWSTKHLVKQIVLSRAFRQESKNEDPLAMKTDPANTLYWRMNRKRLDAEFLRDSMLTASGKLATRMAGPVVRVPLEPEVYDLIFTEGEPDGLWAITPDATDHGRRSIYLFMKRNVRLPLLEVFDQPDTLNPCPARNTSTHALQALTLMNSPFSREMAGEFASRIKKEGGKRDEEKIDFAWKSAFSRSPNSEELTLALDFLNRQEKLFNRGNNNGLPKGANPNLMAWTDLCLALLNANEFVYKP